MKFKLRIQRHPRSLRWQVLKMVCHNGNWVVWSQLDSWKTWEGAWWSAQHHLYRCRVTQSLADHLRREHNLRQYPSFA